MIRKRVLAKCSRLHLVLKFDQLRRRWTVTGSLYAADAERGGGADNYIEPGLDQRDIRDGSHCLRSDHKTN